MCDDLWEWSRRLVGCTTDWLTDRAKDAAGEVVSEYAASQWEQFVEWLQDGTIRSVELVVASWVHVPSPTLSTTEGALPHLNAYLSPITYAVMVLCLFVAAGRLIWYQRGEDAREIAASLLRFVVLVGLGVSVVNLLVAAGDEYTWWILNATTQGVTGDTVELRVVTLLGVAGLAAVLAPAIAMFLYMMVILTGLVQIVLIFCRAAILVMLLAFLPIAAAAAITRTGRAMLDRYMAWMFAWVLWKPVAATIYATAFVLLGTGGPSTAIAGVAAIAMAVFALPALMRLAVPVTAAMGGGGGGGAASLAAMQAATGAVRTAMSAVDSARSSGGLSPSGMKVSPATHGSSAATGAKQTAAATKAGATAGTAGAAGAAAGAVPPAAAAAAVQKGVEVSRQVATGVARVAQGAAENST